MSPKRLVIVGLFILLVGYVFFQARAIIFGPEVWIISPTDGEVVTTPLVTIRGGSRNIARIELNGRQIFTDENGAWEEKLLVQDGPSIMTAKVRDRFGREEEDSVLIYKQYENKEN